MDHKNFEAQLLLILSIIIFIFCFGCKHRNDDSKVAIFYTQDSIYKISIDLPFELDTLYTWLEISDNNCGHMRKYRFQNKRYPRIQDSSYYYRLNSDSLFRLTFSHNDRFYCKYDFRDDRFINPIEFARRLNYRNYSGRDTLVIDTVFKTQINDRNFIIAQYKLNEKKNKDRDWLHYVKGISVVDSNLFVFEFECRKNKFTPQTNNIMINTIYSIDISKRVEK
jgi:hypothetical protein